MKQRHTIDKILIRRPLVHGWRYFFAFTGAHFDARTLIPELQNKAKLIITEKEATGSNVIYRPDARQIYKKFIKAGAKVYPLHVLGITGTKGKSTIAWWLSSLLGFGYMGTLGIRAKDVNLSYLPRLRVLMLCLTLIEGLEKITG